MRIRTADLSDLKEIARVEAACFPAAEAATEEEFEKRLTFYKDHFWLMFEEEKLIAFVDGMVTNQEDLTDEMYEKAEMHDEKGDWQMIFGVNTLPSYRKHGYAGELIKRAITDAKEQGRKGLVLTCKDRLISYYARFGFKNEGVSESVHGNVVWNQMRLTFDEGLELTKIYSIAGLLSRGDPLIRERPFRSPHHTCSAQALAGGGRNPRPGEITLAHRGVLFLDEMPEFSRRSLEILRQPLEDKVIRISRVYGTYDFPADFMLCAAMNPCPCGHYPDMNRCRCTPAQVMQYLGRISQPLLDRLDLCAEVSPVDFEGLSSGRKGESTQTIRERVICAQDIQRERYKIEGIQFNGELSGAQIEKYCKMEKDARQLLKMAFQNMPFSARAYHRILKVARTIADMEATESIHRHHIAEALSYRAFDKKYWN